MALAQRKETLMKAAMLMDDAQSYPTSFICPIIRDAMDLENPDASTEPIEALLHSMITV